MTRVLVVDDDPDIRRVLGLTLRARGYETVVAEDGPTALDRAAYAEPDVVVLDLGLPEIDGMEVLSALRTTIRAPIIILSGRADAADKIDALDAGADDYVTKPLRSGNCWPGCAPAPGGPRARRKTSCISVRSWWTWWPALWSGTATTSG